MKTVLLFSHICCAGYMTGAEKYLLLLAGELSRTHRCTIVVPNEGMLAQKARAAGVGVIVQNFGKVVSLWRPSPSMPQDMRAVIDADAAKLTQLYHLHDPDWVAAITAVNPLPAVTARRIGIPAAWIISEVIPQNAHTEASVRFIAGHADRIVGISETVLAPFRRFGLAERARLIAPSWRDSEFNPSLWEHWRQTMRNRFGLGGGSRLVGFLAADLVPHKGLHHFVQLALEIGRAMPDVHFLVCGNATDGGYVSRCFAMLRGSPVAARFHRLPFIPAIQTVYPALDVLVVPSLIEEGFGMTALEGLIFGRRVAAYRTGGITEILSAAGEGAALVAAGNPGKLAGAVLELLQRPWRPEEDAKRRKAAVRRFGLEAYRRRLKAVSAELDDLARRKRADIRPLRSLLPDGLLVKGSAPAVYLLERGFKRPFADGESFHFYRFRPGRIAVVDDRWLRAVPTGTPISREGRFVTSSPAFIAVKGTGPSVYLWTGKVLRPFVSSAAFARFGYRISDVASVPDSIIAALPKGGPINERSLAAGDADPLHGLFCRTAGGGVYYAEYGRLRPIADERTWRMIKGDQGRTAEISSDELARLPKGPAIRFSPQF